MNLKTTFYFFILTIFSTHIFAQEKVLTAGIQIKPIFSTKFFGTGDQKLSGDSNVTFETKPGSGFCAGMVVRYGITNRVSFETGINYVKRSYSLNINDSLLPFSGASKYRIIGYEIPLSGLVFIQLSEKIFMDVSLGASLDFFPSDVQSEDEYFIQFGQRYDWIYESVIANLGYEYRTEKNGYFYIGASYHRPFKDIYLSTVVYGRDKNNYNTSGQQFLLSGNYLTLDLRYFFHEDPLKKQKKIKK